MDKVDTEELVPKRGRGRPKTKIDEPKEPQKKKLKVISLNMKNIILNIIGIIIKMFLHLVLIVINLFRNVNYQGIWEVEFVLMTK